VSGVENSNIAVLNDSVRARNFAIDIKIWHLNNTDITYWKAAVSLYWLMSYNQFRAN
jgi:hypothetical protein